MSGKFKKLKETMACKNLWSKNSMRYSPKGEKGGNK